MLQRYKAVGSEAKALHTKLNVREYSFTFNSHAHELAGIIQHKSDGLLRAPATLLECKVNSDRQSACALT